MSPGTFTRQFSYRVISSWWVLLGGFSLEGCGGSAEGLRGKNRDKANGEEKRTQSARSGSILCLLGNHILPKGFVWFSAQTQLEHVRLAPKYLLSPQYYNLCVKSRINYINIRVLLLYSLYVSQSRRPVQRWHYRQAHLALANSPDMLLLTMLDSPVHSSPCSTDIIRRPGDIVATGMSQGPY